MYITFKADCYRNSSTGKDGWRREKSWNCLYNFAGRVWNAATSFPWPKSHEYHSSIFSISPSWFTLKSTTPRKVNFFPLAFLLGRSFRSVPVLMVRILNDTGAVSFILASFSGIWKCSTSMTKSGIEVRQISQCFVSTAGPVRRIWKAWSI